MGKKIDGFILSVLAASALYLYFYHAFENHTAALVLAALCYLLLSRLARRSISRIQSTKWMQRRRIRSRAGGSIMHLACMEEDEAKKRVSALLQKCYGSELPMELLQMPPAASLRQEQLFQLWKLHRGEERLVICCTCAADDACCGLCGTLSQPKVALLDSVALSQLIAEHPEGIYVDAPPVKRRRLRLKRIAALLINRRNAPRGLLFAAVMLLLYLLGGNLLYLAGSMFLLFAALKSFAQAKRPAKLF